MHLLTQLRFQALPTNHVSQYFSHSHNLSSFYIPSFDEPDYVCSLPGNNGLSKCDKSQFDRHDPTPNQSYSPPVNTSSYWNKYYTTCRDSGENIYWGSISFDNIGIATVAIFQVSRNLRLFIGRSWLAGVLLFL